ncbi:MAG: hypothetical protein V4663_06385 [Bacteroidota bacterium]
MKSKYLFPTWCGSVGYLLAIPGFVLGYLNIIKGYEIPGFGFNLREKGNLLQGTFENFTNELVIFLVITGLLFIAFSKSKKEDELTAKLRLNSLYWSAMIYYIIYNFCFLLINIQNIPFISDHILELNIFTPLLIFITRFYYLKYAKTDRFLISKPKFLPNKPFRTLGIALAVVGFSVLIPMIIIDPLFGSDDLISLIAYFIMIIGLLTWSFSKNKIEDEGTMQQRLESLQLAVYFNYGILLLATVLLYSVGYLMVLMFAQFSLLLYFVIRMEYVRYKNTKILNTFEGGIGA